MQKVIKNISVMVALAAVTSTQAQIYSLDDQVNHTEVDYESSLFEVEDNGPSLEDILPGDVDDLFGDDPTDQGVPISDYIPFLLIGATGLIVYYRKQLLAKI